MNIDHILEALGRAIGGVAAPLAAEGSLLRGARLFHPDGVVYRADVIPAAPAGALTDLARTLEGRAIVRFSSALGRYHAGRAPRDILGAAVRFHAEGPTPGDRAQDLLFATFRHVWQLPLGPLLTDPRDFLANDYYAVLPFHVRGMPRPNARTTFRIVARRAELGGGDRHERLDRAVAAGLATLRLDLRVLSGGARWQPLVAVALRERMPIDQAELRFDPFRAGLGIEPTGFFQGIRAAVYPASQLGRALARPTR